MRTDAPKIAPLLLTPREAAKALAISPRKLWGMTASGEVPHVRLGRLKMYDPADLARMIESRKATALDGRYSRPRNTEGKQA